MQEMRDNIAKLIDDAIAAAEKVGFEKGYQRGVADTREKLLNLLGVDAGGVIADGSEGEDEAETHDDCVDADETQTSESEKPVSERQRAPRGLVPVFVKRVLEQNPDGVTPNDFAEFASDEFEEMIKLPSIRSELNKGRKDGRYRESGGVWYLVGETETEEAESLI